MSCPEAAFPGPAAQMAIQTPVDLTRSQGDDFEAAAQPRPTRRSDVKYCVGEIPAPSLAASLGEGEGARLGRRAFLAMGA